MSGCEKEETTEKNFPSLYTQEAENINIDGAIFRARLDKNQSSEILEAGFIWGVSDNFFGQKDTVTVENTNTESFSAKINYALPANKEIAYCSYAQTAEFTVFGNIKTFVSKGCNSPEIMDYYPKHGLDGELVTIEGKNLTSVKSNYQVFFGKYQGKIVSALKNKIVVAVPSNYDVPGNSSLNLKIFGNEYIIGDFVLDALLITQINSNSFNIAQSVLEITFNSTIAEVANVFIGDTKVNGNDISVTENRLSFTVPANIPAGQYTISMLINNKNIVWDEKITFNSPWTRKKDSPETLSYYLVPNGFVSGENIIFNVPLGTVIPGERGGNNVFWEYSPQADDWNLKYECPEEDGLRTDMFSFAIDENYYWGGEDYNLYKYSLTQNTNKKTANYKKLIIYDEDNHRYPNYSYAFSDVVDGEGYVVGGFLSTIYPELPFFKYSETDGWQKLESFNKAFNYKYWYGATGFEINGKLYFGTGATNLGLTNEFWCYNPENDSWTRLPDFPSTSRCFAAGFSINGKGYIALGSTDDWYIKTSNSLNDIWEFNPQDNSWREVANFPGGGKSGAAAVVLNNKAYIGFGNMKNDLWEFKPFSN
jgi:hypothetical protein